MTNLLPCPFCGVIPERISHDGHGKFAVSCMNTDCQIVVGTIYVIGQDAAIKRWNTRTP